RSLNPEIGHLSARPCSGRRLRLPVETPGNVGTCNMNVPLIGGIAGLAPRYDGFILDLWGVVHDGVAPLPGALECLDALKAAGKRTVLLSNAPRRSDDVVDRITRIGVPGALYHHAMSSGEEAGQHLHRRVDRFYAPHGRRCL